MNPLQEFDFSSSNTASNLTSSSSATLSRYENQKRRDWNTFGQYLRNHRPPFSLSRCSGAHVLECPRYLDQFEKTKFTTSSIPSLATRTLLHLALVLFVKHGAASTPPVGRLHAAFEENGGKPEKNPFGARAVRLYLREVRDSQAKARGISDKEIELQRRR